jgi:membrane-bound metal-dependent hydrolase YbcI (DUF457 family)
MPSGKTHLKFAFGLWFALAFFSIVTNPIFMLLGSIFPDADKRGTLIGRFCPLWALGFKHRGVTHSMWFAVLLMVVVWALCGWYYAGSFFYGYVSHIALDYLTPAGRRKARMIFRKFGRTR